MELSMSASTMDHPAASGDDVAEHEDHNFHIHIEILPCSADDKVAPLLQDCKDLPFSSEENPTSIREYGFPKRLLACVCRTGGSRLKRIQEL